MKKPISYIFHCARLACMNSLVAQSVSRANSVFSELIDKTCQILANFFPGCDVRSIHVYLIVTPQFVLFGFP